MPSVSASVREHSPPVAERAPDPRLRSAGRRSRSRRGDRMVDRLGGGQRADAVDQPAAGPHEWRAGRQHPSLERGQLATSSGAIRHRASGATSQRTEATARGVDQDGVEHAVGERRTRGVGDDGRHPCAEPRHVVRHEAGAVGAHVGGHHAGTRSGERRRLATGSRGTRRAHNSPGARLDAPPRPTATTGPGRSRRRAVVDAGARVHALQRITAHRARPVRATSVSAIQSG